MNVSFRRCEFDRVPPFDIGTNDECADSYTEWIRHSIGMEPALEFALKTTAGGGKVLDLGANIGYFTLPLASAGAEVIAVEALAANFACLVHSIRRNRFHKVTPVHAAVHSRTGTVHVTGHSAWATVSATAQDGETPSMTLDDLCHVHNGFDADLVKMDVEGSELAALQGAEEFFARNSRAMFIFEANAFTCAYLQHDVKEVLRRFEESGFELYMFLAHLLVPRTRLDFQEPACADYLAVRRGTEISIPGFTVRRLTRDERVALVVNGLEQTSAPHRAYALSMQAAMPPEIAGNRAVAAALRNAREDESAELAAALDLFRVLEAAGGRAV